MPTADRRWLAALDDAKRAELDRSHVVVCTLPDGGRFLARGEGLLRTIVEEGKGRELMVNLVLTIDHRLLDGATADAFLMEMKRFLESYT